MVWQVDARRLIGLHINAKSVVDKCDVGDSVVIYSVLHHEYAAEQFI